MTAIPRYRPYGGPEILSAGFRPFFLLAALWAAFAAPLWLLVFAGHVTLPSNMAPSIWHVHEMVFGFGAAVVAGFLLTSIPNWTGRLPLQGGPLAALVAIWAAPAGWRSCSPDPSAQPRPRFSTSLFRWYFSPWWREKSYRAEIGAISRSSEP